VCDICSLLSMSIHISSSDHQLVESCSI
jgi:hypothetical protein